MQDMKSAVLAWMREQDTHLRFQSKQDSTCEQLIAAAVDSMANTALGLRSQQIWDSKPELKLRRLQQCHDSWQAFVQAVQLHQDVQLHAVGQARMRKILLDRMLPPDQALLISVYGCAGHVVRLRKKSAACNKFIRTHFTGVIMADRDTTIFVKSSTEMHLLYMQFSDIIVKTHHLGALTAGIDELLQQVPWSLPA